MKLELDKAREDCCNDMAGDVIDSSLADLQAKTLEIAAKDRCDYCTQGVELQRAENGVYWHVSPMSIPTITSVSVRLHTDSVCQSSTLRAAAAALREGR